MTVIVEPVLKTLTHFVALVQEVKILLFSSLIIYGA